MQNVIQSQSLVFLKLFSDKGKVYYLFFFLFMRIPSSLIIFSISRRNGRMCFTLCRVKEQQSEALLLGGHAAVKSKVVLQLY